MRLPHEGLQNELAARGARVDRNTNIVYWPPRLVEDVLAYAPSSYTLCAPDPHRDLQLNGVQGFLTVDGSGVQVLDINSGLVRPSVKQDLADAARVADSLEQIAFLWPPVNAQDYPQKVQPLHELEALLANTTKPVQAMTAVNPHSARGSLEIAAAVAVGSPKDFDHALASAEQIEGISGVLLVCGDQIAAWGDLELIPA